MDPQLVVCFFEEKFWPFHEKRILKCHQILNNQTTTRLNCLFVIVVFLSNLMPINATPESIYSYCIVLMHTGKRIKGVGRRLCKQGHFFLEMRGDFLKLLFYLLIFLFCDREAIFFASRIMMKFLSEFWPEEPDGFRILLKFKNYDATNQKTLMAL